MPAIASQIDTCAEHGYTFRGQSGTLFLPGQAVRRQAQATTCRNDAVPGQLAVIRQQGQLPAYPACRTAQAGQFGELSVAQQIALGYACQHGIECRAPLTGACCRGWPAGILCNF